MPNLNLLLQQSWKHILQSALIILELSFLVVEYKMSYLVSPVLFFSVSVLIGVLFIVFNRKPNESKNADNFQGWRIWFLIGVFLAGSAAILVKQDSINALFKIEPRWSDIIPTTLAYVDKFKSGESVYEGKIIVDEYHKALPRYLPLRWFPFVFTDIDPRTISMILLLLGFGGLLITVYRKGFNILSFVLVSVMPFLTIFLFQKYRQMTFGFTLETLISAYYVVFAMSLMIRKEGVVFRSFGILLTLMSRFSSVFFMPFYALLLLIRKGWKAAALISLIVAIGILGIFVLPFGELSGEFVQRTVGLYTSFGANHALNDDIVLNGLGFSAYYYSNVEEEIQPLLKELKRMQLLSMGLALALLAGIYLLFGKRWPLSYFLLGSFKIYLACFYSFMYVPYHYFFMVPLVVSVVILVENR